MTDYFASAGSPVSGVTLQSGDSLTIVSGGLATSVTVDTGAAVTISGGTASGTIIEGGVVSNVSGTAVGGVVSNGGREIDTRGLVTGLTVASGGLEMVDDLYAGQSVSGTVIEDGGAVLVETGSVNSAVLSSGGLLAVLPGADVFNTALEGGTVVSSGVLQLRTSGLVSPGAIDSPTTLDATEQEYVLTGGTGNGTTVGSGAYETVYSGGQAQDTTVLSGGGLEAVAGAGLTDLTVDGGSATVLGTVTGLTVEGGSAYLFGTVNDIAVTAGGALLQGGSATSGMITSTGEFSAVSATLSGFSVAGSGVLQVELAAKASGTIVSSGGELTEFNGGVASGTTVLAGGTEFVTYSGSSVDALIAGGVQTVQFTGVATGATVDDGGVQRVNGATAIGTTVFSGGVQIVDGGTASGSILSGGVLDVDFGTTSGALLLSGSQEVVGQSFADPVSAVGTEVGSGATLLVISGSVVSNTILDAGGRLVLAGGTAVGTIDRGGETDTGGILLQDNTTDQFSYVDQTQTGGVVGSSQDEIVLGSAVATSTTVTSGGMLTVEDGGTAIAPQALAAGLVFVSSGGTTSNGVVSAGGLFGVLSGGVASGTDVLSSGTFGTIGGGLLVNTTIETGGLVGLLEGEADGTVIKSDGGLAVLGGVASGTLVEAGGVLGIENFDSITIGVGTVTSVGSAADTTLEGGGYFAPLPGTVSTGLIDGGGVIVNSGVFVAVPYVSATFYPTSAVNPDLGAFSLTYVGAGGLLSGGTLETPINLIGPGGNAFALPSVARVLPGGSAVGVTVDSHTILIDGGTASGIALDGTEYVTDGAVDSGAIIGPDGILEVMSGGHASGDLVTSGAMIVADDPASTIDGASLQPGGAVLFSDVTYSAGVTSATFDAATGQLTLSDGNPADTRSVSLSSVDANADFQVAAIPDTSDYTGTMVTVESIACYCRGTMIATADGETAVEDLAIGDHILTASGARRPIRWIGRRSYAGAFAARNQDILPILFRAGSLGDGVPRRDLWVSPLHAMFLDGLLIPARLLVNGLSISAATQVRAVEYFHIELETHDILLAEGAAAESFVDDDSRGMFHNVLEYRALYPTAPQAPARYCAPRVEEGEVLAAIHARLAGLAAPATGTGRLRGYLDTADRFGVTGWARDVEAPGHRVTLAILVDGMVIGEVLADGERADLLAIGEGDGRHAFGFPFPGGLSPDGRHLVAVRRLTDGSDLCNSPSVVEPVPMALSAAPEPTLPLSGVVDQFDRGRIRGWAWQPDGGSAVALQVSANGVGLLRIVANGFRGDLRDAGFGDGRHGFDVLIPGGLSPLTRHVLEIRRESDGAALPGTPLTIEPSDSFDPALERAVQQAVAALDIRGQQDKVLSFLLAQTEQLLQKRALAESGAEPRQALAQFRRRWGHDGVPSIRTEATRRALVIDESLPEQGRDAGSEAVLSHMRTLAELGYAVSIVAADTLVGADDALAAAGVACLGRPAYASVEDILRRQAGCFDLVYLHRGPVAARYLQLVRQYMPRAQVIYSVADLHHQRMARQAAIEERGDLLSASRSMRVLECNAAWSADTVITHSSEEAMEIRKAVPGASVHVVPWAVPLAQAQSRRRRPPFAQRRGVAFIGNGAHHPNVDAALWLIGTIMPLVWQADPDMPCLIVGEGFPPSIQATVDPRVQVLGRVADLREIFERVRLTVAPLRYGAGIKGKVLESWAARTPCVLSTVAAEGLRLPGALSGFVGGDADAIAGSIARVHGDPGLSLALGRAGAEVIRQDWSESAVHAALELAIARRGDAETHLMA
jgi:autotransporter passenger strand-loop-strand repeat protein